MTVKTGARPAQTKPSSDRSRLAAIATTMYSKTVGQPGAYDRTKLANGLDIILHHVHEQQWRLAMAREGVYPSDIEVAIVRQAFDAPEAADEVRSEKIHHHPKTRREITYRRVEITWQEH